MVEAMNLCKSRGIVRDLQYPAGRCRVCSADLKLGDIAIKSNPRSPANIQNGDFTKIPV